jgi:Zn-dependent M28 family amino/carboxypeptidase
LDLKSTRFPAEGRNIIVDIPGHGPETVVVCAHYDGHDLAESAMDNATGVAAALQVLESLMPHSSAFRRNLRVIFFTTEEWRLLGSRSYIGTLTVDELRNICIVINLDTLAGSPDLVALTSGFDDLGEFVRRVCSSLDRTIPVIPKVMANSDHFTFSSQGVPAIRLVAGFEKPADRTKYLLTEGDTREKIEPTEFKLATLTALAMVWEALTQNDRPKHKPIDQTA